MDLWPAPGPKPGGMTWTGDLTEGVDELKVPLTAVGQRHRGNNLSKWHDLISAWLQQISAIR
jgi:hypothetical protein